MSSGKIPGGADTDRVARWYFFKPKIHIWIVLEWKKLVYSMAIWNIPSMAIWCILWTFGTLYGHLEIQWNFGIFYPVLVYSVKKNLASLGQIVNCNAPPERKRKEKKLIFFKQLETQTFCFPVWKFLSTMSDTWCRNRVTRLGEFSHVG
jgi:hypothetical protein